MKINRSVSLFLAVIMALLVIAGCGGGGDLPVKSGTVKETPKPEVTEVEATEPEATKPEATKPEATKPETPETSAATEPVAKTTAPAATTTKTEPKATDQKEPQDSGPAVDASTKEKAAGLGVWVATKQNGKDMELGDIRFRVTSISEDKEAIMALIEAYNADDNNFRKVDTELPDNTTLKLCEYEVVYEKGYPGFGEDKTSIYKPDLYFSIAAEDGGGLDTADGYSHIGLRTVDISKKVEDLKAGDTFKGHVIYVIPNNAIEQYYLAYFYSDKDKDGNPKSHYSYVKPEEIKVEKKP